MLTHAPAQTPADTQKLHLQLRILSGAHEGACVALDTAQAVHLSNQADADIWISDAALFESGNAWLYADAQHWWLVSQPMDTTEAQTVVGDPLEAKGSMPLGQPLWLGDVCMVVCDAQAPWEDPALWAHNDRWQQATVPSDTEVDDIAVQSEPEGAADAATGQLVGDELALAATALTAGTEGEATDVPVRPLASDDADKPASAAVATWKTWAVYGACLIFMALVAAAVWWGQSSTPFVQAPVPVAPISEAEQQQYVQEARMLIAMVDPGLRLQIDPRPQGGVRIAGWLQDQQKLDQVVQALAGLRPLPQVALQTTSDLNDVVQAVGQEHGMHLLLRPQSQSQVKVSGVLWTEDKRQAVLSDVQQRLPEGVQLEDGLYAPSEHVSVVEQWLRGLGLDVKEVAWQQENLQLHVRLRSGQRRTLEQALLRKGHPLQGIPFRLVTADNAGRTTEGVSKGRLPANAPGVPVAVRTVVGGTYPYLVTLDGRKLQPGAQVGAWRLVSIASDHVLWDGPQRLEVAR